MKDIECFVLDIMQTKITFWLGQTLREIASTPPIKIFTKCQSECTAFTIGAFQ